MCPLGSTHRGHNNTRGPDTSTVTHTMSGMVFTVRSYNLDPLIYNSSSHHKRSISTLCLWHHILDQKYKRVPLAGRVGLCGKEGPQELWEIGYGNFELAVYRKDVIFVDVGHGVQVGGTDRNQRFDAFGCLSEEAEACAADIFICMLLEIIIRRSEDD